MQVYDKNNVFAKIIRKDIPCQPIYENAFALCFPDIRPQCRVHALVIPKGEYISAEDFALKASADEQAGFWQAIAEAIRKLGLAENEGGKGFRLISNAGSHGHQEVPHFHVHILGGEPVGKMVSKE